MSYQILEQFVEVAKKVKQSKVKEYSFYDQNGLLIVFENAKKQKAITEAIENLVEKPINGVQYVVEIDVVTEDILRVEITGPSSVGAAAFEDTTEVEFIETNKDEK